MIPSILLVALLISILITIHEFGHLIVAKLGRIPVEAFSIGFGPVLLKRKFGETEYRLSAVPLGGYIKMAGEEEYADPALKPAAAPGQAGGYMDKPLGIRVAVIAAGPVSNLLLGFAILCVAIGVFGESYSPPLIDPKPGSSAGAAGLRPRDLVLAVAGDTVTDFAEFEQKLVAHAGTRVAVRALRSGRAFSCSLDVPSQYVESLTPAVVGEVLPDWPAARLGLRPGDTLTSVAGATVHSWSELVRAIRGQRQSNYEVTWRRASTVMSGTVDDSTAVDPENGLPVRSIGITVDQSWYIDSYVGAVIGTVRLRGPADRAGLRPGDTIISAAGQSIRDWNGLLDIISARGGEEIDLAWIRGGREMSATVTPALEDDPVSGSKSGKLAITAHFPRRRLPLQSVIVDAGRKTGVVLVQTFIVLYRAVTVRNYARKAVGGPIMVARVTYEGTTWGWEYLLSLLAVLSVNLFVVNMLPIPVMDGGRIALDVFGAVRRRRLSGRELNWAANAGWIMIGLLIAFTLLNDILRLLRK